MIMTYVMNMNEVLCMFVTTVIKCHSLSNDILCHIVWDVFVM